MAEAAANDPVARLNRRLGAGEIKLDYDSSRGYLRSVLDALAVPVSSQVLVFSKTSIQSPLITPRTPRAVYHSDEVSVSWVNHGDMLELTAWDPKVGVNFYTLRQEPGERPMLRVPAIHLDVVLLHAQQADVSGNVQYFGPVFFDVLMAQAARKVIVSVDRIVPSEVIRRVRPDVQPFDIYIARPH